MSLSICLVTRNAAQRLPAAVASVADLDAQRIVIDTGSTDDTVDIARRLGATVCAIAWQDDFAAAQNAALAAATGAWILWLNPDEELLSHAQLPALVARPDVFAYGVHVLDVMDPDRPDRSAETWQMRLYRRHADVRYVGRLHPQFVVPLEELARRQGQQLVLSDVWIRRHAYLSPLTEDKLRWATRLLELELGDRPGQLHYLIEYGQNQLRLNDPRGHAVLAEAAEQVLAVSASDTPPVPTVASLLEYLLTVAPAQSRSRLTPEQCRDLALRWFATSPPLLWCLAQRAFAAGDFAEAAGLLERLIALGQNASYDRTAAFDPSIMGAPAVLNLARCHIRLGNYSRAEGYLAPLVGDTAHQAEARSLLETIAVLKRHGGTSGTRDLGGTP